MGINKPLFKCQCGCKEWIPYSPRHKYPSRKPKFKKGHSHRNKFKLHRDTIEMEYLAAGSGHKLAKKYGISYVAVYNMLNKLGIKTLPKEELEDHNLRTGRQWELFVLKELKGSIDCSGENWGCPYDIIWNGYKIDIKISNPVYVGNTKKRLAWSFKTRYKHESDYFLCIGLNEKGDLEKVFWIPSNIIKKQTTIRRNGNTKYEIYKTSFDKLNHQRQSEGY